MNIAVLTWEYTPFINGGLGRYIEYYTQYFTENGHKLWVFTFNTGELPKKEVNKNLVVFRPIHRLFKRVLILPLPYMYYNYASFKLIKKLCKKGCIDIISVHDWLSCPAGILCSLICKRPVAFHIHNTEFTMMPWNKKVLKYKIIKVFEKMLADLASCIIVPSEKMYKLLVHHNWDFNKIKIIRHGFDNKFKTTYGKNKNIDELRGRWNISVESKVLLFVGRLTHSKGVFSLIQAMKLVTKKNPDAQLIMIGKGQNEKVTLLIQQLILTRNIHVYDEFLSTEDVVQHYLLADICVFPSLYEPFGLVALEAMALGRPVILGDGFPEFFKGTSENTTALFVDSQKPENIAEVINSLLEEPEIAHKIGKAAQNFVENNFDWNKTFQITTELYQEMTSWEKNV